MNATLRENHQIHIRKPDRKRYHLTPATADKDYGPEAITPTNFSQEELKHICKNYLKSLQVTAEQAAELPEQL